MGAQGQGMRSAEMLVWLGDFNYRIACSYVEAKQSILLNELDRLLEQVMLSVLHPCI